jgi:hypothetical protein
MTPDSVKDLLRDAKALADAAARPDARALGDLIAELNDSIMMVEADMADHARPSVTRDDADLALLRDAEWNKPEAEAEMPADPWRATAESIMLPSAGGGHYRAVLWIRPDGLTQWRKADDPYLGAKGPATFTAKPAAKAERLAKEAADPLPHEWLPTGRSRDRLAGPTGTLTEQEWRHPDGRTTWRPVDESAKPAPAAAEPEAVPPQWMPTGNTRPMANAAGSGWLEREWRRADGQTTWRVEDLRVKPEPSIRWLITQTGKREVRILQYAAPGMYGGWLWLNVPTVDPNGSEK